MQTQPAAPTPSSIYDWYRQSIREAVQQKPEGWAFKSDEGYRQVLEHVSYDQGTAFLNWVHTTDPGLDWDLVVRIATLNDSFGQPIQYDYPGLGKFSPSNWRYLCHALKVWRHINSFELSEVDLIELGGGYGGLALYIHQLAPLFATHLGSYTLVDLPEPAVLQNLFLDACNLANLVIHTVDGLNTVDIKWAIQALRWVAPPFFVSAYAFSEFDQETRSWYVDQLIRHCAHGLIVWNCPEPIKDTFEKTLGGPVYQFTDKPLTIEPDLPNLYIDHKLVRW